MQLDAITESRDSLLKLIRSLDQEALELLAPLAADCHLRPVKVRGRPK